MPQLKLYNTLSRKKQTFKPLKSKTVRIYSCGPTVYDFAHIGNFRAYLFGDLLYRYLRYFKNYKVEWVMNITDVDDKTIRDSKGPGDPKKNLQKFTQKYEKEFLKDMETLKIGILSSLRKMSSLRKQGSIPKKKFVFKSTPRATEHIPEMQNLIRRIVKNGYGYIQDGSIYFNVTKYANDHKYGQLLNIDMNGFKDGARIDNDEYEKESVQDFVLWKAEKKDEPSWDFKIDGSNLPGRPGWHIECNAMSEKHLKNPFDIHTGGVDLIFPHHENEIAQSIAGYRINHAKFWCHNAYLMVDNQKMSKSLGNFYTLRDLIQKGYHPRYFRYFILSTHYRTKFNFSSKGIDGAKNAVERIQELIYKLLEIKTTSALSKNTKKLITQTEKSFEKALDDDLNMSEGLATVFNLVKETNRLLDLNKITQKDAAATLKFFQKINQILAVLKFEKPKMENAAEIEKLITARNQARENKDFKKADQIRDQLAKKGIILEDTSKGTLWKKP